MLTMGQFPQTRVLYAATNSDLARSDGIMPSAMKRQGCLKLDVPGISMVCTVVFIYVPDCTSATAMGVQVSGYLHLSGKLYRIYAYACWYHLEIQYSIGQLYVSLLLSMHSYPTTTHPHKHPSILRIRYILPFPP
jgi:hypothetical protein